MFAEALGSLLLAAQQVVIPFGHPRVIEPPKAPIQSAGPAWAVACDDSTDVNKPAPPVRIHGNSYLVGTCGASAMLIDGEEGEILIDCGTEQSVGSIVQNIDDLGFSPSKIRYILRTGPAPERTGGIPKLERTSGARVVDNVADGQEIRLGNLLLTAIGGPASTSWRWESCDGGVCRTIVYAADLHPKQASATSIAALKAAAAELAASPCEVLVTADPAQSDLPNRLALGQPIFDPSACKALAAQAMSQLQGAPGLPSK